LIVENEGKEREHMEGYVGRTAEGWGGNTCGCGKKKKNGTDGGMEVGESDVKDVRRFRKIGILEGWNRNRFVLDVRDL